VNTAIAPLDAGIALCVNDSSTQDSSALTELWISLSSSPDLRFCKADLPALKGLNDGEFFKLAKLFTYKISVGQKQPFISNGANKLANGERVLRFRCHGAEVSQSLGHQERNQAQSCQSWMPSAVPVSRSKGAEFGKHLEHIEDCKPVNDILRHHYVST
jgi:hypothetical protein